jgi:hypothetical protein
MLTYKLIPTSDLIPYARNSRTHSEAQVTKIASSIKEFGFINPVVTDGKNGIVAGHGRVLAANKLGLKEVPCVEASHLTEAQKRAYVIADNRMALDAGWDIDLLKVELGDLQGLDFDLSLTGFDPGELENFLAEKTEGLTDPDAVPETPANPVTVLGDVWVMGKHRLMCGDSTSISDVQKLMAGATAQLLHADPPYGMGKASDGVANDNLYREKLDAFQMEWWATFRTFMEDNASAYIWGNAPDLWRLWYRGGLGDSERMELRNQLVWDKKAIPGMKSDELTQYPVASEHCLFFQLGEQFRGNINTDHFPEDWEPVQSYMAGEAAAACITAQDVKRVCGVGMYGHWFTRSQFTLIPQKHYLALKIEYPGHFSRPWSDLFAEWETVKNANREKRGYFDNSHDIMRDVWEFARVTGEDRHGHATPKPVDMMQRVMKSSLPKGGLCAEPFGGSGSTLIGAEKAGRICYTMEMQPRYVDVIVKRWQEFTGNKATLESTGQTFEDVASNRYDWKKDSAASYDVAIAEKRKELEAST